MKRFERVASPANIGGLGLGLYIASQLVHAHGGSLEVQSERRWLDIAYGTAGASLASWGVNLLSDTAGAARMLTLKTAAATSLMGFSCFMLPSQIKTDPRLGGMAFSVTCWTLIGAMCVFSEAIEQAAAAATTQTALGNVPHTPASENALSMYWTAAAGLPL